MTDQPDVQLVKITVDGRQIEVPAGELLIKAAQDHGTYIPRFCWHPRMKPVGMCRMCLVEIETPRGKALVPSCTTPVSDGLVVETASPVAKKAQEGVLEFLLINHPLDCPVCDRGGECPLQDQTMSYGPGESRFVEEKRHYEKPIEISELVLLDRERCILCARCTRFSEEVSGDPLIEFVDRGYGTQVLTFPDEPFRSYFSGNTVQICPVGALTARPYRFRARPWDLKAAESTCPHCTVGDRIAVHTSSNRVLRFLGVDADATNRGWLSDKCRFGFEYIAAPERLTTPLIRGGDGRFREVTWGEALAVVADRLAAIVDERGGEAVGAIGGARLTNEDAYVLGRFMRTVIGSNHVDAQLGDGPAPEFLVGLTPRATIGDVDRARTILVWGPDLKEELGTLYLRVRHAAQEGARLIVVHPRRTGLDDVATHIVRYRPGDGAATLARLAAGEDDLADVRALLDEGPVVALIGRTSVTEDPRLAEGVAAFIRDLPDASILPLARRSNVFGALDMGLAPTLLPGRVPIGDTEAVAEIEGRWGPVPTNPGLDTLGMLRAAAAGDLAAVLLVGADPVRDVADPRLGTAALEAAFVVAIDQFLTDSSTLADVVLPAEGFGEKDGTVTNLEGRVQRVVRVVAGAGQSRPDWSILEDLAGRLGKPFGFASPEAIAAEIAEVAPAYRGLDHDALWEARDGVVVPTAEGDQPLRYIPAPLTDRATSPGQGLRLHHGRTLYDDGVLLRHGPSLRPLAPGAFIALHPADAERLGLAEGDRATATSEAASVTAPVRIDPTLAEGAVYVPFNQPDAPNLGFDVAVEVTAAGGGR